MSKGGAPQAPDYTQAAAQTNTENQGSAANATSEAHPDQSTPWGTSTWGTGTTIDPATGQTVDTYTQNVNLSPQEQAILAQQQGGQLQAQTGAANYGTALNSSGILNPVSAGSVPGASIDQNAEDAAWNEYQNTNAPIFQQQTNQLQTQLANQGLTPQDAAWETANQNLQANQNNANSSAASQAYLTGIQGGQAQQGEDINQLNAQEGAQTQGVNLLNGLLGDTSITNPFAGESAGVSQAAPSDTLQGAQDTGQADLNAYNAQAQSGNSLLSGLVSTGLGAASLAML